MILPGTCTAVCDVCGTFAPEPTERLAAHGLRRLGWACRGGSHLCPEHATKESTVVIDKPREGDWMQTFTGRQFWPIDPHPDEIEIEDVAHALSNICRYNGHCNTFYSVAEHSVYVSLLVPQEHALVALLHDATEAYVCDVPRPLKRFLPGYKEIEERMWTAVADRFNLRYVMPQCVKDADNAVLIAESEILLGPKPAPWTDIPLPDGLTDHARTVLDTVRRWGPMTPEQAESFFFERFNTLSI